MNNTKRLAAGMVGAVAIATLVGTSAFAESRHSDATTDRQEHRSERSGEGHDHGRGESRHGADNNGSNDTHRNNDHGGSANSTYGSSSGDRHNGGYRNNDSYRNNNGGSRNNNDAYRNNNDAYRNNRGSVNNNLDGYLNSHSGGYNRSNESYRNNGSTHDGYRNGNRGYSQSESYRNERGHSSDGYRNGGYDRSQSYGRRNSRPDYDDRGRRNMSLGGRINRFLHERGGYRVWVDGGRYPIWIPDARISLFPHLRVGLSVNFGGYYDPLGYLEAYDYYDGAGYGYGSAAYSSGLLRGVVETVDYRRGTLVLRDETSGSFVTAFIRDRRLESLRPGDYAEISGQWTRNGVFEALSLENVDGARY